MTDARIEKLAEILVDYSTKVKKNDRVGIITTTEAIPLVRVLYGMILERGAHPHTILNFPGQEETFYRHAQGEVLDFVPEFHRTAFEDFEVLIKISAFSNTRELTNVDQKKLARRKKALSHLLNVQMRREAAKDVRRISTRYPTQGYAIDAGMGLQEYQDFVYKACRADTDDPVSYWLDVRDRQDEIINKIKGAELVELRGPNIELDLSVKARPFINACGQANMPDGEIFTGPEENSANGWVRFTYPAIYSGTHVEGAELVFKDGKVVEEKAAKNQQFLTNMLNLDEGSRYLGEFAVGLNNDIDIFTGSILFDEKIGGTIHLALGSGYPETGSVNKSTIHWDMICDMRTDSEIKMDGEVIYRNGEFKL